VAKCEPYRSAGIARSSATGVGVGVEVGMGSTGLTFGAVALGGAIGSVARLAIGAAIQERAGLSFPFGTLIINITGSLLLGFLVRIALDTPAVTLPMRAFLTTGICGGYTTFSTFSYETAGLIDERAYGKAAIYAAASVVLAITATFAGFAVARWALSVVRAR
jgi:fluoride exporter